MQFQIKRVLLANVMVLGWLLTLISTVAAAPTTASGPTIQNISTNLDNYPQDQVPQYAKFEVSLELPDTTATNPYFPYDEEPPTSIVPRSGVTVELLTQAPGSAEWNTRPCFYYQTVEEVGNALLPTGPADWRCRLTPATAGQWTYYIRVTDASGTSRSDNLQFSCVSSDQKGFIEVSSSDSRFFAYSDGSPFTVPLINVEEGNPFNTLPEIRENIQRLGENGVRFVRWFPTGEGANYFVAPFADSIRINWHFSSSGVKIDDVDSAANKKFSFRPYYYATQQVPVQTGERYRISFKANIVEEKVLRAEIGSLGSIDVCSASSTQHAANGETCDYQQNGWHAYSLEVESNRDTTLSVGLRGLYVSADAPSPYNVNLDTRLRTHSLQLQRLESDSWGANLLTRSDPDTYNYVDQRSAARLDEILRLSEEYGVYHKLTLFHKNDELLARFQPDGTVGDWDISNFYSSPVSRWYQRAYVRYFIARWGYSTALHSLELANENNLDAESQNAAFDIAEYVRELTPRHILLSNSFWGWWVSSFWTDPERGEVMDYADQHWYANESGAYCDENGENCALISNLWADSAAYVRECATKFRQYSEDYDYQRPIVRGEGGVAVAHTQPQHPDIASDPQGTYYHKKLWAHVGVLGASCDGEWYPRLFLSPASGSFPNQEHNLFQIFSAYEHFFGR